jgi:hypothetical protein
VGATRENLLADESVVTGRNEEGQLIEVRASTDGDASERGRVPGQEYGLGRKRANYHIGYATLSQ